MRSTSATTHASQNYHNSPIYVDQMPLLLYYGEAGCAVKRGALDGWKL